MSGTPLQANSETDIGVYARILGAGKRARCRGLVCDKAPPCARGRGTIGDERREHREVSLRGHLVEVEDGAYLLDEAFRCPRHAEVDAGAVALGLELDLTDVSLFAGALPPDLAVGDLFR